MFFSHAMHAITFFIIQLCFFNELLCFKVHVSHFLKTQPQIFEAQAMSGETEAPWFILQ